MVLGFIIGFVIGAVLASQAIRAAEVYLVKRNEA